MIELHNLKNTSRFKKRTKLLGRGPGSGSGKTSGRGNKGAGSRSGYKTRAGKIGGGVPLHRQVPTRGFSNALFKRSLNAINLETIERLYFDGEIVSLETLRQKGYLKGDSYGIKVLGKGTLSKKVSFKVEAFSTGAKEKLKIAGIEV